MNVFVLCTGRCGSTSFFEACRHAKNYSASHEDKRSVLGRPRFEYPENHIAVDYRLSWMLQVETVEDDFPKFWGKIGAEGNLDSAMIEWRVKHNDIDTVEVDASAAANS